MRKITPTLALTISLASATVVADGSSFNNHDVNRDGIYSGDEFHTYVEKAGIFDSHDLDNDGQIDEQEFEQLNVDDDFDDWDVDNDSSLTSTEFRGGTYKSFDDNEDGHWDEGEWDDAGDAGLFDV